MISAFRQWPASIGRGLGDIDSLIQSYSIAS